MTPAIAAPKKRGPQKNIRQQIEQIEALPATKQRMVVQMIDAVIAQATRYAHHQRHKAQGPQRCGPCALWAIRK